MPFTGLNIGKAWNDGDFKSLRIAGYGGSDADLPALTVVVNATRGTDWSEDSVGEFYGHPAFELERDSRLVWAGDTPVAAAICYPAIHFHGRRPGNFEIFVVPQARGHGLGGRLLAHLEQAARARGHHVLETTVDQHDETGRRFLLEHGFRIVGQAMHLVRPSTAPVPPFELPPGFEICSLAEEPDAPEIYRDLCNRLGAYDSGHSLIEPEEMEITARRPDWEPAGIFVLEDPTGREVGVIHASGTGPGDGYLHEISLDPAYRGQNLGRALVGTALAYLTVGGVGEVALDTEAADSPSYRLATRCGFVEQHRWQQFLKLLAG